MESAHRMRRFFMLGKALLLGIGLVVLLFGTAQLGQVHGAPAAPGNARQFMPAVPLQSGQQSEMHWYSTQLHLHGWSNHNANPQPGSMQYHSVWAKNVGLDVIWWSDHNGLFEQYEDLVLDLRSASVTDTLDVVVPLPPDVSQWSRQWYVGWLEAEVSGDGYPAVTLDNNVLRMSVRGSGAEFDRFQYRMLSYLRKRIGGHSFVRHLMSDPVLRFNAALCGDSGPDVYAEVVVRLSWHDYDASAPQELVYRLVPVTEPALVLSSTNRITYTVPVSDMQLRLPLLTHAALLQDGDDNAVQEIYLAVGARNGATSCLEISNLSIHSRRPDPADGFDAYRQVMRRYESRYGVVGLAGWEQNAGKHHFNLFLPADAAMTPTRGNIYAPELVPLAHSYGGVISLNHPFGATYPPMLPAEEQEARVQSVLDTLLPQQAWGVDLIEVYLSRAGVDLAHHLELWDLLAANGISLCGVAASDQHGGPLTSNRSFMVSWIEAASPEQDSLLEGLRRCRVFFGHLGRFDGILDLRLGSVRMGGIYPAQTGIAALEIIVDPLPSNTEVRLVHVLKQPGHELVYLADHKLVDPTQPVLLDTGYPSLVRVELWNAAGEPIAFSNPIYIEQVVCDVNGDGNVTIADLQEVAGAYGQPVPPASGAYDLRPDERIDVRDVELAAQCWLTRLIPAQ